MARGKAILFIFKLQFCPAFGAFWGKMHVLQCCTNFASCKRRNFNILSLLCSK